MCGLRRSRRALCSFYVGHTARSSSGTGEAAARERVDPREPAAGRLWSAAVLARAAALRRLQDQRHLPVCLLCEMNSTDAGCGTHM